MENASKALTMAGGILIGLIILGAFILMFNNLSSYQNYNDETKEKTQVAEFNSQFIRFDKQDLTLMELKSVYNKIVSYNSRNPDEKITENIKSVYANIEIDFSQIPDEDKQRRVFKCVNIGYNAEGKINSMKFEKVK